MAIIFGEIDGIPEGYYFQGRKEMMSSGFHRKWAAGIDGNKNDGTAAIVLSGGYEDDFDEGVEIVYTGAGGNDTNTGRQIADQSWDNQGNAGLLKSMNEGLPVRVIRGSKHASPYSPKTGYTYGGLYSVVDAWEEIGKSGYKICRFRLIYNGDKITEENSQDLELDYSDRETKRKATTILRIVRETRIAHQVKELYDYECQVCGITLLVKSGRYAEGAHIKPLGKPHNGDDNLGNLLCLCPNHHVLFDKGSFSITDDFELVGDVQGELIVDKSHSLNIKNLQYHRNSHGYD